MRDTTFNDRQEAKTKLPKLYKQKSLSGDCIQKMREKLKSNMKPHLQIQNQAKYKKEE